MAERNKKLYKILCEFGQICGKLMDGEIRFRFCGDPLLCALKPGHPGDVMDDIVWKIYNKLDDDPIVSLPTVKESLKCFKAFRRCYCVSQLDEPIMKLAAYVAKIEARRKALAQLRTPRYNHLVSTQGVIDKACAKTRDVYVYYRRESRGATVFAVYSADGVPPIKDAGSVEKFSRLAEYPTLREAKASPYGPAFTALWKFVKEQIATRKAR